ncbi:aspartate--tRNA(Asn) ligase [Kineosporia sp. R_H_3]|uniref:aspartate--tRNA(Asn) ligase n=1 Tax=Kineosporia sp. R_H_3 TaxID=1961848 RepID=UPI000B4C1E42|nr:aspartate--tRNA(Asn) ligase [Kineosporia sp. R_H_3]
MRRILSSTLPEHVGGTVRLEGWVHRRRRLAAVTFLVLRDRAGLAQVVVADEAVRRLVEGVGEESVVRVTGTVTANPKAPGGVEVTSPAVEVLSTAQTPPVELWRPTLDVSLPTLLDHASTTWRHPRRQAVWRLAAASVKGFRERLDATGFTEITTPKLVASSTESGANVFGVEYFGRTAYLAQSPQFYKQAMVGVFERVYEVGPVFRAEPHDTVRHLAEYVSLDVELGFVDSHRDVLAVLRDVLAGMVASVRENAAEALALTGARLPEVPEQIPVVHFTEALRIAGADPDEPDLAPEHERVLGAWALAEHGSDLLAVEGYPAAKRPFYTHPQTTPEPDGRWTNSFDLLFRGLELVTGGQRLHRYEDYVAALAARGESPGPYESYLETFRYGMPPHGGFAIGLERWTARLVEADNIRTTTLFPRDLHRLTP